MLGFQGLMQWRVGQPGQAGASRFDACFCVCGGVW